MPVLNYRDPVSGNWIPLGTGGGGSGNVATDVIWDTKGDLAVATGPDAAVKLPVGTNGQVLTADSTVTPTGLKWATAGASLTALNQALLATKIWSSTQYVWPNGTAPDTNAYTNIIFIDPTGLHDPKTSTGGRNNANDLWETGTPTGTSGSPLVPQSTQTASYTLVLTDGGTCVEMNVATANTLTVPPNSSVAFPTGTIVEIFQLGAGQTTLTPGAGVTIRSDGGKLKLTAQYASVSLRKRGTDEWVAAGDLST